MFYHPKDGHGLPHNPFNAIVSPRPIGWIATRGPQGDNLAPYSFFNAVAYSPPQVMFASNGEKDSLANIRATSVFCTNVVAHAMLDRMNASSEAVAYGVDEFALSGVGKYECEGIDCPRVADAPASFECEVIDIIKLRGEANFMVLGEVTGVHILDTCLKDGRFDVTTFHPVSRLGYFDYSTVETTFALLRPGSD